MLVVGAGLAGCSLARALGARGRPVVLLERGAGVAVGASGNPVGLAKPYVTRAPTAAADYLGAAHAHLLDLLGADGLAAAAGYRPVGALQLTEKAWEARAGYRVLDAAAASTEAGTRLPGGALAFDAGGWLDPGALCRALLATAGPSVELVTGAEAVRIARDASDGGWELETRDGRRWRAATLVLATGAALAATPWTRELPLEPARGQITRFAIDPDGAAPQRVVAGRRYAIPDGRTLWVGATFAAGDAGPETRAADDAANLAALATVLPDVRVRPAPLSSHAGVRATTPDRLPMVGPVPDVAACRRLHAASRRGGASAPLRPPPVVPGLAVLGGFGARGIVAAPLAAELVADWLDGGRRLERWGATLLPVRFALRALRRESGPGAG